MIVLVLGMGATAFGATLYQRSAFNQITTQLETELDATVSLVRELRSVDVPMGSIFYELGTPAELEGQVHTFNQRRRAIDAAFDRAERVMPVGNKNAPLVLARAAWSKTADAVLASRELWGTSVVKDALASGRDPFSKEWTQLREAQGHVTGLTAQSLEALRAKTAEVDKVQAVIPAIVFCTLVLTLLLGAWSAGRLSRRVVAPALELRKAALRMRDGDLQTAVDLGAAGRELHDLAEAMNELASSLHTSHGLLRDQAYTDAVTGLANRKAMTEHLIRRADEVPAEGTALLFIDLDDFKVVNDSLGHDAGDQVLAIVASRLLSSTRDTDHVARLGGDEFAIALDGGHDPAAARATAERVLAALSEPLSISGTTVPVSCSIGIALSGVEGVAAEELLGNADMAMYAAKNGGKHRHALYSRAMHSAIVARMSIQAELSGAVDRDQLVLHYQPVVDLATTEILGWEALVRWQHPDQGLIPPNEFIPLAEQTGDICTLGAWVLDRACQDFAALCPGQTGRWLSVNVSAHQLLERDFAQAVSQTLHKWGVAPASLVLEFNEAALVTSTAEATAMLANLQRSGVRVAVDDFGSGLASLWRLHELPVDIIKIGPSFLTKAHTPQSADMLAAIVAPGTTLGLDMIVGGIERHTELEQLTQLNGLAGQGYYFAHPMPLGEAQAYTGMAHCLSDDLTADLTRGDFVDRRRQ